MAWTSTAWVGAGQVFFGEAFKVEGDALADELLGFVAGGGRDGQAGQGGDVALHPVAVRSKTTLHVAIRPSHRLAQASAMREDGSGTGRPSERAASSHASMATSTSATAS
jgi:hypothetical protein